MSDALPEYPVVDLATLPLKRDTGRLLSALAARKIEGLCIMESGDTLLLAVKDPSNVHIHDMVEVMTEGRYRASLTGADPALIDLAQEWVYLLPEPLHDVPWTEWLRKKAFQDQAVDHQDERRDEEPREITGAAVERADQVLKEAIALGASDIHLETYPGHVAVRYRVDGVLELAQVVEDREEAASLVKRLKVLARVDIAQDRITQGGRISLAVGGRAFDVRVSVVPVATGENMVLRLLSKAGFQGDLPDLGLGPEDMARFREALSFPDGLVLVSGPTGSGKTTTLYASLRSISRPDRKVLTVEDPVEYQMAGVTQVQVNTAPREPSQRVTFASALREFLRQDPDVILVGEIRDPETAQISVQAALTGHLVLSTLHTNDAVGIVNRLKDQGVPPYLVASTLSCGLAQRLARRLCPSCRIPAEPPEGLFARHGLEPGTVFRAGPGCEKCRRTGHSGRVGLFEVLPVTDEIRRLIECSAPAADIADAAREAGMTSMARDGLAKAARGLISLDEVARVTRMGRS